jgi:hypothetical protein
VPSQRAEVKELSDAPFKSEAEMPEPFGMIFTSKKTSWPTEGISSACQRPVGAAGGAAERFFER